MIVYVIFEHNINFTFPTVMYTTEGKYVDRVKNAPPPPSFLQFLTFHDPLILKSQKRGTKMLVRVCVCFLTSIVIFIQFIKWLTIPRDFSDSRKCNFFVIV